MVLCFNCENHFNPITALHRFTIIQRHSLRNEPLQQCRIVQELEILPAHEDLIPGGLQRLFQTEELRRRGKVEWSTPALADDADLVFAVTKQFS